MFAALVIVSVGFLAAFQAPASAASDHVSIKKCKFAAQKTEKLNTYCELKVAEYGPFDYIGAHLKNKTDENCLLTMFQSPKKQYFFFLSANEERTIDFKFNEPGESAIITNKRSHGSNCKVKVEYHVELK